LMTRAPTSEVEHCRERREAGGRGRDNRRRGDWPAAGIQPRGPSQGASSPEDRRRARDKTVGRRARDKTGGGGMPMVRRQPGLQAAVPETHIAHVELGAGCDVAAHGETCNQSSYAD
jgi:hypothetical protein